MDYAKKNLQFIRDIEKRQQHQKAAASEAAKTKPAPFKLQQFKNVSPKVQIKELASPPNQQTSPSESGPGKPTFAFLKKGQRHSAEVRRFTSDSRLVQEFH